MKKTKIVATLGPASNDVKTIRKLKDCGMNCARINTAHGTFESYEKLIKNIREVGEIPILIDVKGPELRVRTKKSIPVKKDAQILFSTVSQTENPYFSYNFLSEVEIGKKLFFDNGQIEGILKDVNLDKQECTVEFVNQGEIKPNKGVNIPGVHLNIPNLSEKDKKAVEFAKKQNVDYIALSFVRNKKDIENLKELLKGTHIKIISKIENQEGVDNIREILDDSTGVMIARGDLGVEIPEEKIPYIQKYIIKQANRKSRISIVATEMLESMIENIRPTRAEISDVANAVLDGTDSVMLSGETAVGKYPVEAITAMRKACIETEDHVKNNIRMNYHETISEELSKSAYFLAIRSDTNKIVTLTRSGYTARLMSRYRMREEVLAVTTNKVTYRQLKLVWGVEPIFITKFPEVAIITNITKKLLEKDMIRKDELIVFFAGVKTLEEEVSNLVEIHKINSILEYDNRVKNK